MAAAHDPQAYLFLQRWAADTTTGTGGLSAVPRFVATFTRGLAADGTSPSELVGKALGEAGTDVALVRVYAPLYPKEWAAQSAAAMAGGNGKTEAVGKTTSTAIPPRPQSARASSPDVASPSLHPPLFSGTALTIAVQAADPGVETAVRQYLAESFPRESTSFVPGTDAAALDLLNACIPLCTFGAGLVGNRYPTALSSSLAAYTQHAVSGTETLLRDVLGRSAVALPAHVWATLCSGCTNYAARDFVLGRTYDFHFRQRDALQAVYPAQGHHPLCATVDGLYALLRAAGVSSPFYEALIDTFSTFLRASSVGEGLVKMGCDAFRDPPPSLLMQHVTEVDAAMLSGDEERFEAAKRRVTEAFSGGLC